jgi:hypothetical protein
LPERRRAQTPRPGRGFTAPSTEESSARPLLPK